MEEVNPWLDPQMGSHSNKKSIKPEKVVEIVKEENVEKVEKVENRKAEDQKVEPISSPVSPDDRVDRFLDTLVTVGLDNRLPPNALKWAEENFGKEWTEQFGKDLNTLTDELLTSHYFPSEPTMILLKLVFLLRQ